jgi:cell division protein FtsB
MKSKGNNKKFVMVSLSFVIVTLVVAYYVANLLFYGDNSYEVYQQIKHKRVNLQKQIKKLQQENAKLQKQYFELKNLEPEEL